MKSVLKSGSSDSVQSKFIFESETESEYLLTITFKFHHVFRLLVSLALALLPTLVSLDFKF